MREQRVRISGAAFVCGFVFAVGSELRGQSTEFRAFWVDVWGEGFKSVAEVDTMVSRAVTGRYNAILAEILAYHDNRSSAHGAYWNSSIVPKAPEIPGGFDPLAYVVQQAHASGLEVHAWLVPYRACLVWPPSGNAALQAHPEWIMTTLAGMGLGPSLVDGEYDLDPGSPDVQQYLVSIVQELVTYYAIDGVHWDRIRYSQTDAGYPAYTWYTNSGLERFRRIVGYGGTPATNYGPWNDFRRREITELVRRVGSEIPAITGNPRQPLRHSAALITWSNAPAVFSSSSAWVLFQNWEEWMRLGFLDTGIAMTYYDEDTYPTWYRNWVDKEMIWRYYRHMVVGAGTYLNEFVDSITQMQYARSAGANGLCTYSYRDTRSDTGSNWDWYPHVANNFFTTTAAVPAMGWRDPATATEGMLWGRVTDGLTGLAIDDATVQVSGMNGAQTDGNGYYAVTLIPAGGSGTNCSVTASKTGWPTVIHDSVQVVAGDVRRDDFFLGGSGLPPTITQQPEAQDVCPGMTATFTVTATGDGILVYQWQKNGGNLTNDGHYSGVTTATLTVSNADGNDAAAYRCRASNAGGSVESDEAALTLKAATTIGQHPIDQSVLRSGTATFIVAASGEGAVSYQWQRNGANLGDGGHYSGATTAMLTISSVDSGDAGNYRCEVTAGCGGVLSKEAVLTVRSARSDLDADGDVDGFDFLTFSNCYNGSAQPPAATCLSLSADLDADGDVDGFDFLRFSICFNGSNRPPNCTPQ